MRKKPLPIYFWFKIRWWWWTKPL